MMNFPYTMEQYSFYKSLIYFSHYDKTKEEKEAQVTSSERELTIISEKSI